MGTYKDIPEARWEEVVVWFRARLARAAGNVSGGKPAQESLFPAE